MGPGNRHKDIEFFWYCLTGHLRGDLPVYRGKPGKLSEVLSRISEFYRSEKEAQTAAGKSFQLKEFHQYILELGPAQFPVLKKYLLMEYK